MTSCLNLNDVCVQTKRYLLKKEIVFFLGFIKNSYDTRKVFNVAPLNRCTLFWVVTYLVPFLRTCYLIKVPGVALKLM